jgi:hypothetical protein
MTEIATEGIRIGSPDAAEENDELETAVEFRKMGNDFTTQIYHHITINFTEKSGLWSKMCTITKFLDAIVSFSSQYEKDKQVDIYVGAKYTFGK